MQGQYNHHAAYYRCRYPQEYALANTIEHPRNVYLREDWIIDPLDAWLAAAFDSPHRGATITAMCQAQAPGEDGQQTDPIGQLAARIAECDKRLERYKTLFDAGADPDVVAEWIKTTQAERAPR